MQYGGLRHGRQRLMRADAPEICRRSDQRGEFGDKREMRAVCLVAQQKRTMPMADGCDGCNVRTCTIIIRACKEYGIRMAAGKRGRNRFRRNNTAKGCSLWEFRVNKITCVPSERNAGYGGFMAIPRKEHTLVFAKGKQHCENPCRRSPHEQKAVSRSISLRISLLGC